MADNPLKHARALHAKYVTELTHWNSFVENRAGKVFLWQLVFREIQRARKLEDEGKDPTPSPSDIYDALGLPSSVTPWWELELASHENSLQSIELKLDRDDISHADNEFVSFGIQVMLHRTSLEIAAQDLVGYLSFGQAYDTMADPGDLPKTPNTGTHANDGDFNEFVAVFERSLNYAERLEYMADVTERLGECDIGRRFLATLHDQGEDAVFHLGSYFDYDEIQSTFPKWAKTAFDDDGKLATELNTDVPGGSIDVTDEGKQVANAMARLLPNLLAGLNYYGLLAGDDVSDAMGRYYGWYFSSFVNDEDIEQLYIDAGESWTTNGLSDSTRLDAGNWDGAKAAALGRFLVGKGVETTDRLAKISGWHYTSLNVQFTLVASTLSLSTVVEAAIEDDVSVKEFADTAKAIASIVGSITDDVAEVAAKGAARGGGEAAERSAKEAIQRSVAEFGEDALRRPATALLKGIPVVADLVAIGLSIDSAHDEFSSGDYSVGFGQSLNAVSAGAGVAAVLFGGGEAMAASATLGAFLLTPAGMAVAVAVVAAGLALYLTTFTDDPAIVDWIRETYFGSHWSDSKGVAGPPSSKQHEKNMLRWRYHESPEGTQWAMQTASYFSLYRPVRLGEVKVVKNPGGDDFAGSADDPMGVVEIGVTMPGDDPLSLSDVFEGDHLYLRTVREENDPHTWVQQLLWKVEAPSLTHNSARTVRTRDGVEVTVTADASPYFETGSTPQNARSGRSFRQYEYDPQPSGTFVDWIVTIEPTGPNPSVEDVFGLAADATNPMLEVVFVPAQAGQKIAHLDASIDDVPTLSRDIRTVSFHV